MTEPTSPLRSRFSGPPAVLRLALLLGLASLYLSLSIIPSPVRSTLSLVLASGGVGLALRIRNSQKAEPIKVRILPAMAVSLLGTFIAILSLGAAVLLHTEIARYDQCRAGAITHVSTSLCQNQLRVDLNARIAHLRSSSPTG